MNSSHTDVKPLLDPMTKPRARAGAKRLLDPMNIAAWAREHVPPDTGAFR